MSSILNILPIEIRLKIWHPLLEGLFDGNIPNIIKAFRGEDRLYQEILGVFCTTNTYSLSSNNGLGFLDMSFNAIHSITKVKIIIDRDVLPLLRTSRFSHDTLLGKKSPVSGIRHLYASALVAINVHEVEIEINPGAYDPFEVGRVWLDSSVSLTLEHGIYQWGNEHYLTLLAGFRCLLKVFMIFPVSPHAVIVSGIYYTRIGDYHGTYMNFPRPDGIMEPHPVLCGNNALGVAAKLDRVLINCINTSQLFSRGLQHDLVAARLNLRDKYVWMAEPDTFLIPQ